jgi:hypothetical protein
MINPLGLVTRHPCLKYNSLVISSSEQRIFLRALRFMARTCIAAGLGAYSRIQTGTDDRPGVSRLLRGAGATGLMR